MLNYSQAGCIITLELQRVAVTSADAMMSLVANAVRPVGPPDPAHIFMRYYHSESARSQVGTGLGLWLVRELVRQLDSKVHYEMVCERAVFSFRTYAGMRPDRTAAHSIIVVEDNELLREKMRLFLSEDGVDMLKSA